jgi:type I restriction enzyme S subunit
MISDWKILSLGEIADIKRGLPSQDLNYVESDSDGVRLIRINDFKSDSPKFIKETDKTKKLTLKKGDVLIAGTGATAGISFLVNDLWDGLPFSYNAPRIRVKKGNSSTFVYFILNSEKIKRQQNKLFTGNAQPFLDTRAIASFNIPVPPLAEQQKIAEILSTLDVKIEVIDQQIIETQALKKGLMQRLLTKGIGHTEFKDSPLGMIPKSWEVVELKTIFPNIVVGFVGSVSDSYCSEEDGIIFIRTLNVRHGRFSLKGVQYVNTDFHDKNIKSQIKNDDILIARVGANMGMVCKVNGLNEPANSANVIIVKGQKGANSDFYTFFLCSSHSQKQIHSQGSGGAQEVFNTKLAQKLNVVVPSISEQAKIAEILSSVDEKLEVLLEKKTRYQELKQGLMQQLLMGKIRVTI